MAQDCNKEIYYVHYLSLGGWFEKPKVKSVFSNYTLKHVFLFTRHLDVTSKPRKGKLDSQAESTKKKKQKSKHI